MHSAWRSPATVAALGGRRSVIATLASPGFAKWKVWTVTAPPYPMAPDQGMPAPWERLEPGGDEHGGAG